MAPHPGPKLQHARQLARRGLVVALTLSHFGFAQSARPVLGAPEPEKPPPARLPYSEGQPIPEGYRLKSTVQKGELFAGVGLGGVTYLFGGLAALGHHLSNHSAYLFIPVAGPWLMLAAGRDPVKPCMGCPTGDMDYTPLLVVVSGLAQIVAVPLIIDGATTRKVYLERSPVTVSLSPLTFGSHGYGVGASGSL